MKKLDIINKLVEKLPRKKFDLVKIFHLKY